MNKEATSQFISSLVKSLQVVCHGHVDFRHNIEIVGHIYLNVDKEKKYDYILNEQVCKDDGESSTKFVSNSFHAQPPPKLTERQIPAPKPTVPRSRSASFLASNTETTNVDLPFAPQLSLEDHGRLGMTTHMAHQRTLVVSSTACATIPTTSQASRSEVCTSEISSSSNLEQQRISTTSENVYCARRSSIDQPPCAKRPRQASAGHSIDDQCYVGQTVDTSLIDLEIKEEISSDEDCEILTPKVSFPQQKGHNSYEGNTSTSYTLPNLGTIPESNVCHDSNQLYPVMLHENLAIKERSSATAIITSPQRRNDHLGLDNLSTAAHMVKLKGSPSKLPCLESDIQQFSSLYSGPRSSFTATAESPKRVANQKVGAGPSRVSSPISELPIRKDSINPANITSPVHTSELHADFGDVQEEMALTRHPGILPALHVLTLIERKPGAKKQHPQRQCRMCSIKARQQGTSRRKETRYYCKECKVALCKMPCYDIWHKQMSSQAVESNLDKTVGQDRSLCMMPVN